MTTAATDFDLLVSRGFMPTEVREALSQSKGDLRRAMLILTKAATAEEIGSDWTTNSDVDWVNRLSAPAPIRNSNRALWKSPVYVRVGSFRRGEEENTIFFVLNVILKDGRHVERLRRLSQFITFYESLPRGLISNFSNKFPKRSLLPWQNSSESIEKKRALLEEWMRELCMNEPCMTNSTILNSLYHFLDVTEVDSPGTATDKATKPHIVKLSDYKEDWVPVPEKTLSRIPVSFKALMEGLPFKIRTGTIFSSEADVKMLVDLLSTGADVSDKQLAKDLARDRIIINGRRIAGSATIKHAEEAATESEDSSLRALHDVLLIAEEMAYAVIFASGHRDAFSAETIRALCLRVLKKASRTYSAFICHTALHRIVEIDSDVCIVPESILAMPLVMRFAVSAPPVPHAPPVLRCELQAATVYRFCAGIDMNTILQIKAVFCKTFREMPKRKVSHSVNQSPVESSRDEAVAIPPDLAHSVPTGSPSDSEVAGFARMHILPASRGNSTSPRGSPLSHGTSTHSAPSPTTPPPADDDSPALKYKAAFRNLSISDVESEDENDSPAKGSNDSGSHTKTAATKHMVTRGEYDSEAFICLVKEMATTSRDWRSV